MSSFQDEIENNNYIQNTLNPLLEPLIVDLLMKKPQRKAIVIFIIADRLYLKLASISGLASIFIYEWSPILKKVAGLNKKSLNNSFSEEED